MVREREKKEPENFCLEFSQEPLSVKDFQTNEHNVLFCPHPISYNPVNAQLMWEREQNENDHFTWTGALGNGSAKM